MISLDRLGCVSAERVGQAAMSLIDSLQHHTPEEQAAGFALVLTLFCRRHQAHPGNALGVAENLLRHSDVTEIRAARLYIENET